jgi:hypothetical protein
MPAVPVSLYLNGKNGLMAVRRSLGGSIPALLSTVNKKIFTEKKKTRYVDTCTDALASRF